MQSVAIWGWLLSKSQLLVNILMAKWCLFITTQWHSHAGGLARATTLFIPGNKNFDSYGLQTHRYSCVYRLSLCYCLTVILGNEIYCCEKHIIDTKRLLLTIIMGITYKAHTRTPLLFLSDPPYLYLANGQYLTILLPCRDILLWKHIIGTKTLLFIIIMGITCIAHTLLYILSDPPYLCLANG